MPSDVVSRARLRTRLLRRTLQVRRRTGSPGCGGAGRPRERPDVRWGEAAREVGRRVGLGCGGGPAGRPPGVRPRHPRPGRARLRERGWGTRSHGRLGLRPARGVGPRGRDVPRPRAAAPPWRPGGCGRAGRFPSRRGARGQPLPPIGDEVSDACPKDGSGGGSPSNGMDAGPERSCGVQGGGGAHRHARGEPRRGGRGRGSGPTQEPNRGRRASHGDAWPIQPIRGAQAAGGRGVGWDS